MSERVWIGKGTPFWADWTSDAYKEDMSAIAKECHQYGSLQIVHDEKPESLKLVVRLMRVLREKYGMDRKHYSKQISVEDYT